MLTLLKNARIVDGLGNSYAKGWLLIKNGKIHSLGVDDKPMPFDTQDKGRKIVDLIGMTLMPGLIDAHVHLTLDGSPDAIRQVETDSPFTVALKAAKHAKATLKAGFTTVRDAGGKDHLNLELRDAVNSGLVLGPRILTAGHCICITGGHAYFIGLECDGSDEVRKTVRKEIKNGVDFIKMMSTGGLNTPGIKATVPQFTHEELRAGITEAHKAGKKTSTHALGCDGIANSLEAGIDSIEHGFVLSEGNVEAMLKNKRYLVATLTCVKKMVGGGTKNGIPAWAVEKAKLVYESAAKSYAMARSAGVNIVMGTDAGTPLNFHGDNIDELLSMLDQGFTPMEILIAATSKAAELLDLSETLGSLTEGKLADFLVVDGDVLSDLKILKNSENIKSIYKGGELLEI